MESNSKIEMLKKEFPNKAIDIYECMDLLREVMDDSIKSIESKSKRTLANREYENCRAYVDLAEYINQYENSLEKAMDLLNIDQIEELHDLENDEDKNVRDYSKYLVDDKVEHSLYESFTHIKPASFKVKDKKINVSTWQDILVKTCEFLIKIDSDKFLEFEDNKKMRGRKRKYFSKNSNELKRYVLLSNKINVEVNLSANSIRNLIIKLLKEYNFKISDFKVYFKADYSDLNNQDS